jgi:DNA-binding IscR family transcriptional regulator
MIAVEDYILGGSKLHERLCVLTEIMAKLVSSAPREVGLSQLESATGRPAKDVAKLCASLWRAGLVEPSRGSDDCWRLACEPSAVTLEDVFRCVIAEQKFAAKPPAKSRNADQLQDDVELLVTQAMIAINQSILKHLRQFSLDRLKISATGAFPAAKKHGAVEHEEGAAIPHIALAA